MIPVPISSSVKHSLEFGLCQAICFVLLWIQRRMRMVPACTKGLNSDQAIAVEFVSDRGKPWTPKNTQKEPSRDWDGVG